MIITAFILTSKIYAGESVIEISTKEDTFLYSLSAEVLLDPYEGRKTCTIIIRDKQLFVSESTCPEQICILKGEISEPGEWIACLPHNVFILINGTLKEENELDSVSF